MSNDIAKHIVLLELAVVAERTLLVPHELEDLVAQGLFPAPVIDEAGNRRWDESHIDEWIAELPRVLDIAAFERRELAADLIGEAMLPERPTQLPLKSSSLRDGTFPEAALRRRH